MVFPFDDLRCIPKDIQLKHIFTAYKEGAIITYKEFNKITMPDSTKMACEYFNFHIDGNRLLDLDSLWRGYISFGYTVGEISPNSVIITNVSNLDWFEPIDEETSNTK